MNLRTLPYKELQKLRDSIEDEIDRRDSIEDLKAQREDLRLQLAQLEEA